MKTKVIPDFGKVIDLIKVKGFRDFLMKDCFECSVEKSRVLYWKWLRMRAKSDFLIKTINGYKMLLSFSDPGISRELMVDGVKEPQSTAELPNYVGTGDIVLDIGANIGYYALLESQLVGPTGSVIAVEPVLSNIEMLKRNMNLNNSTNIEVHCLAMGEKVGTSKLYLSRASNQGSMLEKRKESSVGEIDVETTTVDEFLKTRPCPNFLRMDVEGFESNILRGASKTLDNPQLRGMFIEVHSNLMGRSDTVFLFETLQKKGYEISAMFEDFGYLWVVRDRLLHRRNTDYSDFTIDSVLNSEEILNGTKGGFEIYFKRGS